MVFSGGKKKDHPGERNIDGEPFIPGALEDHVCALAQASLARVSVLSLTDFGSLPKQKVEAKISVANSETEDVDLPLYLIFIKDYSKNTQKKTK